MAQLVELFKPGDDESHTVKSGQAVIGKRLVEQTADFEVQHAGAASLKVAGVARYDANAGELVAVVSHGVVPLVASGAITAGAPIMAAANGTAAVATNDLAGARATVGIARSAAADGQEFFAKLSK